MLWYLKIVSLQPLLNLEIKVHCLFLLGYSSDGIEAIENLIRLVNLSVGRIDKHGYVIVKQF